jgi:hypothetical protein
MITFRAPNQYSCEFEDTSVSLTQGTTVQKGGAEVKHSEESLLLCLHLMEQQSEQLVTKDEQLPILRQENEMLRQSLERMGRRVTLQKHREISELLVPTFDGCISPRATSPLFTTDVHPYFLALQEHPFLNVVQKSSQFLWKPLTVAYKLLI